MKINDTNRIEKLTNRYIERFKSNPKFKFSSPGRIEICGNHTDHNGGKVLVGAIDCDMVAVVDKAEKVTILSEGYKEFSFNLNEIDLVQREIGTTRALVKGVFKGFADRGLKIGGFSMCMDSKIFKGAGISSSAAFELLVAEVLNRLYNDNIDRMELAKIGQYSENVYFGKPSGLLDQSGISLGGVCEIDFASTPVVSKIDANLSGYEIVIVNTGDHSKLTNEYTKIRTDMSSVSAYFGKKLLCEVDEGAFYSQISQMRKKLSGRAILRAMHFFEENKRVEKACEMLRTGDIKNFLEQISASGRSSELYLQNTTHPNDKEQALVLALKIAKDIITDGAVRVHGGGFAGTIIAFINKNQTKTYVEKMSEIFGSENILIANIRPEGATIVEL